MKEREETINIILRQVDMGRVFDKQTFRATEMGKIHVRTFICNCVGLFLFMACSGMTSDVRSQNKSYL